MSIDHSFVEGFQITSYAGSFRISQVPLAVPLGERTHVWSFRTGVGSLGAVHFDAEKLITPAASNLDTFILLYLSIVRNLVELLSIR